MPVSPQDFELYSRMTGAPMPTDAMSRMQMAPEVFKFTKDFAKKPNILEKTGNLIKTVGKIGLMGLGEGYRQSQANEQRAIEEQLRNKAATTQSEAVTMDDPVEEVAPAPMSAGERMIQAKKELMERQAVIDQDTRDDAHSKAIEILNLKKQDLIDKPTKGSYTRTKMIKTDPPQYEEEVIDPFPQEPTTADSYGQDYVPNQTASNVVDRKISQGSQIADSTPNIAEVLSENQDSQPSGEMVGGEGKNQLAKFLSQRGLDQALLGAIGERMIPEPRIGDNSPLLDHPDIIGGEDDAALPGGTNTSPTQDLSSFHKEMRKMDAMERNKEIIDEIVEKTPSPSEKQVGSSPNELAGKDQATFEALMNRAAQTSTDSEAARSRVEQKTAAKQRMSGINTPLTEKYYPSNVARTDIQVGGMVDRKTGLGKSVGISYTPMNGDTKVGFNIMSDPTKPTEVSTFDFVAPPETMESMESHGEEDLGSKTFGKLFNIARQKKQGFSGLEM